MPNVTTFELSRATFDTAAPKLPRLRAAGALHDPFEHLSAELECGASDAIFEQWRELDAGRVHATYIGILGDILAHVFWKDDQHTALRPCGIPESERRAACACLVAQKRNVA